MASGFTRPDERLSRSGLTGLVGKIKSGSPTLGTDYSKVVKGSGPQPAKGGKTRKF